MSRLICCLTAIVFIFGAAVSVDAKEKKKKDPKVVFAKLDKNSDDKVSEEEFVGKKTGEKAEKAKKAFARKDKNKDGSLSLEEFSAKKKKKK